MKRRLMTLLELVIAMSLISLLLILLAFFYQDMHSIDKAADTLQKENFQIRYAENRLAKIIPEILDGHQCKGHPFFYTSDHTGALQFSHTPSLTFLFDNKASIEPDRSNTLLGRLYVDSQKRLCLMTWPAPTNKKAWSSIPPSKKEILLENVSGLSFEFYVPPDRDRSLVQKELSNKRSKKKEKEDKKSDEKKKTGGQKITDKKTPSSEKEPEREQNETIPKDETASTAQEKTQNIEPGPCNSWLDTWRKDYNAIPAMIKIQVTLLRHGKDTEEKKIIFAFPLPNSKKVIVYAD
jgi:hypothetical protein